ncbi:sigma-70 family RNA polymerase sigma factor [Streptomyces sp. WI04-05B]|uniref:sigma-70 family RNA polymerase sigma factor n=1 Tax=Streptomyces TaxID=1883 RepID=UPI0029A4DB4D|nr:MULTISPECIES: sigma-70 family RNA polymerase sigma factor [unclassified Streptomyces]MDX2546339.1 sigma-70 family RNA polymerase sigma factor [Streptomyces sp. WI04-05B]MDX2589208.1 sigma-70 family RNA polymerase sigma factor [Streptomyces sp. WI04-05A]
MTASAEERLCEENVYEAAAPPTAADTAVRWSGTELVEAARSGDAAARSALFQEYLPLVYNVVGRGLHGHPDVDDVVQETMLRALRALPRLREPERFRGWLVAIAVRQMYDHGRRRKASTVHQTSLSETGDIPDASAEFAELTVDRRALARAGSDLLEAGRWLSDEERRTMALWWQETAGQLSRAEVAAALDLTVPHTAVRIQRMKAKLELAVGVLAAWRARPRCADLTSLTAGGPAAPGARVLTRLSRHVRECPRCQAAVGHRSSIDDVPIRLSGLAVPAALAAGIPGLVGQHGLTSGALASLWRAVQHVVGRMSAKSAVAVGATATLVAVTGIGIGIHQYLPDATPAPRAAAPAPGASTAHDPGPAAPASASPSPAASPTAPATTPAADAHTYSGLATADLYVAPDGDDTNPGTLARPFATVARALSATRPGQTVAVRGGTYRPAGTMALKTSGTADRRITVSNYRDERPLFDGARFSVGTPFVVQSGAYLTVRGLEIVNAPDIAYACASCHDVVLARLSVHGNGRIGLLFHGAGTNDNLVLDSDFFDNHESGSSGGYADGLVFRDGSGTGNRVQGCRTYDNSGDGTDVSGFTGAVAVERTWSFGNGVNHWGITDFSGGGSGFKLGGGGGTTDQANPAVQTVTNSAAWDNAGFGFTEVGDSGTPRLTRNTAYRNGAAGFAFVHSAATLEHNLALANHPDGWLGNRARHTGDSWDQPGWTTAVLRLTGSTTTTAPRGSDGSLPATRFLTNTRDATTGAAMS